MLNNLKRVMTDDEGATLVEYGLIVALIAVFCIGAVTLLGQGVNAKLNAAAGAINPAVG
jgi:pilus assembly protein Flp/PilA